MGFVSVGEHYEFQGPLLPDASSSQYWSGGIWCFRAQGFRLYRVLRFDQMVKAPRLTRKAFLRFERLCVSNPELAAPSPKKKYRDRLGRGTYTNGTSNRFL